MAVTNYYSVNGQLLGEKTSGGSRVDYLTDALGSVTATVDQSANLINTYRYKPYGALLAKTGGGSDPAFQWVGSEGYRNTGKSFSEVYVRARHYSSALGRWTTQDPARQGLQWYAVARNNPVNYVDPLGLWEKEAVHRRCTNQWARETYISAFGLCPLCGGYIVFKDPATIGDGSASLDSPRFAALWPVHWPKHFNFDDRGEERMVRGQPLDHTPDTRWQWFVYWRSLAIRSA